ncbi:MazG-like family protein [Garciella nitratireducens]|uniref:MazG-like family protein n=1 Tax=Garciella nitratireducens DSM 15102 TaxID=1121911 RepID=A0A1T4PFL5_9FIRM|nr:MazG-like family protein [Garciella nitratireducens]RBP44050.1 MazG-like nucleotide pyrophosphohydrolase family protein [Garciella nitratireducens]SJZ90016.1 MazG-like family protein [Garciella nitratireducens DSM 15102]
MPQQNKNMSITKSIRMIEWCKCELLAGVSSLFDLCFKGAKASQEMILDTLSNIIMVVYIIGRRLGVEYSDIDKRLESKLKLGILEEHEAEKWFGDLSDLSHYIKNNR